MALRTFGLIGYPLSHSFSKKYFTQKFEQERIPNCTYELFPIEKVALVEALIHENKSLEGINVTIPYKVSVLPYLNEVEEAAAAIGAVNCIAIQHREGAEPYLKGFNTDAYGFEESLKPFLLPHHQKALVFGNGGAAKAVKYVLQKLGISYLSVVRSPAADALLYPMVTQKLLEEYTVLINTTPLGTSPNVDSCPPIPYHFLSSQHLAYDLVYNPEETLFLRQSKAQGAKIKNGMEMLKLQAERSWFIWNQKD